jgi:exosome complex RNA-binding protein Csl4
MRILTRSTRLTAAILTLLPAAACSSAGGLGNILGSVLGGQAGQGGGQVSGYIQGVDTRNRQIGIQQSNGQTLVVAYDNQTQVVYNNQSYSVTSLENGDQVTARVQQLQNGGYYTDVVQVDRSVSGPSTIQSGNVQLLQGTVRQVDQQNGLFLLDANNGTRVTVQLTSQLNRSDLNRFRSLRPGDYARFYGVYINNSRVELRQFN